MFRELLDRLLYRGYLAAEHASTERVVRRYSRGNTSIQQGRYLNDRRTELLLAAGDKAAGRLLRRVDHALR